MTTNQFPVGAIHVESVGSYLGDFVTLNLGRQFRCLDDGQAVQIDLTNPDDVANYAELDLLETTNMDNGASVYVATTRSRWTLDKASALTVNPDTCRAASGGGRFLRELGYTHSSWLAQPTWFVNASTGNDENTGLTSLLPIKTFAEISRRWGVGNLLVPSSTGTVSVEIQTDLANTDPITFNIRLGGSVGLLIKGTGTTILYTGAFSAVTAKNRATNTPLQGTDAAVPGGWAAFLSGGATPARVHDTTNDGYFWPAKDLGAGAARFSEPFKALTILASNFPGLNNGSRPAAAVTVLDAFTLERLTKVFPGSMTVNGSDSTGTGLASNANNVAFQDLHFDRMNNNNNLVFTGQGAQVNYYACLNGATVAFMSQIGGVRLFNCNQRRTVFGTGGSCQFIGGLVTGNILTSMGQIFIDLDAMFQGNGPGFQTGSVKIGTMAIFDTTTAGTSNNPTGDGIHLGPGCSLQNLTFMDTTHAVWGSGNQAAGIGIQSGATFGYQTNAPSVTGATPGTDDFTLSLATSSRAWDEAEGAGAGAWSPALVPNSWANLVAAWAAPGLNHAASNVGTGARIAKGI